MIISIRCSLYSSISAFKFSVNLFHGNHRPGMPNEEWLVLDVKLDGEVDGRPDWRLSGKDLVKPMAHLLGRPQL